MIRFVLVMLMALAGMAVVPAASAQTGTFRYPDQSAAYAACLAAKQLAIAKGYEGYLTADGKCTIQAAGTTDPFYRCRVGLSGGFPCDKDYPEIFKWEQSGSCSSRPVIQNAAYYGATFCSGGCAYEPDDVPNNPNAFTFGIADKTVRQAKRLRPTGQACESLPTDPPQKDNVCVGASSVGGELPLTQCVTPDGKTCSQSSSGKLFCWQPDERGTKTSGNEAATKVGIGQTANPPPVPPKNGGDWQKTGEGSLSITDNRTNTTNNYTTNNWSSSYGGAGSGAAGGGSAGEGNGGSGDGSGDDDGGGEGDGPGGPGAGVGSLYTGSGKTVAGVFGEFKARVGNSPLIAATRDFFTVNASGGCPVFTVSAGAYWDAMTYEAHCSGDFLAALRSIGWVLMAIAALAAAYWALS